MKKPKILLLTLCASFAFGVNADSIFSWFGKSAGDDGNPNTVGNSAAANKTKPTQTTQQLNVGVVNKTNATLASAVLKDKSGKVLYTSTKGKTCISGDVCWMHVTKNLVKKGNTFFFYDTKNNLVAAYMAEDVPANLPIYNISASMDNLGLYVFNRIHAVNPKVTYTRVDNDIVTTKLSATPYQELADYYLDLMGNTQDNTMQETKIIKGMADQFAKNKPIPANPDSSRLAKNKPVMAKATNLAATKGGAVKSSGFSLASSNADRNTVSPLCASSLGAAMDGLGMIPMVGDALKTAANTIRTASCPDSSDAMTAQFATINTGINDIKSQLSGLDNQLKAFEQIYNSDVVSKQKLDIDSLDTDFSLWLGDYQNALLIYTGPHGEKYNSLSDLVNSFGGLDGALAKNPGLAATLNKLYEKSREEVAAPISQLSIAERFSTDKVNRLCGNPNNIAGNIVSIRNACNAFAVGVYSKNIMLEKQVEYAFGDVSKVYAIDARQDKQLLALISPANFATWVTNIEQMNPNPNISNTAFIPIIKPTEPVYKLVENLRNKGFTVTGWNNETDKRYLEVTYNQIKSRYAYLHPTRSGDFITYDSNAEIDNNIANVMGVPVPERFFTSKNSDGVVVNRNNYGASEAFPWDNYDNGLGNGNGLTIVSSSDSTPQTFTDNTYEFAFNAFSFSPAQAYNGQMVSPNNGFIEGNRKIFAKETNTKYTLVYAAGDLDKIGNGEFFTLMRFTDADGFSHVAAIRTWLTSQSWVQGATQCMTNDCVSKSHVGTLGELKFQNGPRSVYLGTFTNNQWTLSVK